MATAKHRAIDLLRRKTLLQRKHLELGRELGARQEMAAPDLDAATDDDVGDDLLRLMFTACHPVLSTEARLALTLRLLGGLTTGEIARAFLVPEPTVAQRIARAKRTLAEAHVPFGRASCVVGQNRSRQAHEIAPSNRAVVRDWEASRTTDSHIPGPRRLEQWPAAGG
jgi:predicted RNA polymerase sigma factor